MYYYLQHSKKDLFWNVERGWVDDFRFATLFRNKDYKPKKDAVWKPETELKFNPQNS